MLRFEISENHIPLVLEEISMLSFWRYVGYSKLKSISKTKYKHVKRERSLDHDTDLSSLIIPSLKQYLPLSQVLERTEHSRVTDLSMAFVSCVIMGVAGAESQLTFHRILNLMGE